MSWRQQKKTAKKIALQLKAAERQWLTVEEVAIALAVNPQKVYREIRQGGLPHVRVGKGGTIRVHRTWLDGWLRRFMQNAPTGA